MATTTTTTINTTTPRASTAISGSQGPSGLPIIPLEPLLDPSSPQCLETAQALLAAFRTAGFFYLTDYSSLIPYSQVETVFEQSKKFFARPQEQKDQLACRSAATNRGYLRMGREKASSALTAEEIAKERQGTGEDMKETIEIGREDEEGNPNRWPVDFDADGVAFTSTMQAFFLSCKEMHSVVMRGIALGMGLGATFFDEYVSQGDNNLRLLHYPAVPPGRFDGGRMRTAAHSDYGSVSFLWQDQSGGLQVEKGHGSGEWIDVEPKEGYIVVNAGDVLARWSNDLIRSTKHRVVQPPSRRGKAETEDIPPRYSIAYFCNPNYAKWIEALPGTWENVPGGKKYEGVNSRDYLVGRLSATY
ncbi:MAG: hypothetical protein Q9182_005829 [Xanthomendoza sp. 2 TL-2023]